jgi:hypothetical protein
VGKVAQYQPMFAYFDESGMHGSAPDTVVAGYLFSKAGAKNFRRIFQEGICPLLPVNDKGQRIFHASQCIGGYGEYETLSKAHRERIVELLVDGTKKCVSLGTVEGIEKPEYAKAVANSPVLRQLAGSEYTVCLHRCIANMAEWLNNKNVSGRVMYVFEAGCEHQQEAKRLLANISQTDELQKRYRLHGYAFVDKRADVPQLSAPDLLAWEWQRARVNSLNPKRGEWRKILKKLIDGTPHIGEYLSDTSVGVNAIVNTFYGITSAKVPYTIKNSFFHVTDFPAKKN